MVNIQNINDNECFKWCAARYLHPGSDHPARIRMIDEILADELDFEDIKFPARIKDIHKIQKKYISNSVFG